MNDNKSFNDLDSYDDFLNYFEKESMLEKDIIKDFLKTYPNGVDHFPNNQEIDFDDYFTDIYATDKAIYQRSVYSKGVYKHLIFKVLHIKDGVVKNPKDSLKKLNDKKEELLKKEKYESIPLIDEQIELLKKQINDKKQ